MELIAQKFEFSNVLDWKYAIFGATFRFGTNRAISSKSKKIGRNKCDFGGNKCDFSEVTLVPTSNPLCDISSGSSSGTFVTLDRNFCHFGPELLSLWTEDSWRHLRPTKTITSFIFSLKYLPSLQTGVMGATRATSVPSGHFPSAGECCCYVFRWTALKQTPK